MEELPYVWLSGRNTEYVQALKQLLGPAMDA
jgi:hypothetical protein